MVPHTEKCLHIIQTTVPLMTAFCSNTDSIPLTEWWLARVNAYKTITSSYRFFSDAGAPALMYVVVRSMALFTSSVI